MNILNISHFIVRHVQARDSSPWDSLSSLEYAVKFGWKKTNHNAMNNIIKNNVCSFIMFVFLNRTQILVCKFSK